MADEIAFDDFELYYCAGNVLSYAEEYRTGSDYAIDAGNGELYFVYDLTGDAEGAYSMFRVDIHNPEVGALMYLTDVVFFANEEAALEWCGYYNQPTTEATTEEVTAQNLIFIMIMVLSIGLKVHRPIIRLQPIYLQERFQ